MRDQISAVDPRQLVGRDAWKFDKRFRIGIDVDDNGLDAAARSEDDPADRAAPPAIESESPYCVCLRWRGVPSDTLSPSAILRRGRIWAILEGNMATRDGAGRSVISFAGSTHNGETGVPYGY